MHSKLAKKAIGALVSSAVMISMIPAVASASISYDYEEVDFTFSGDPVMSGDSVTVDGITLTVGGGATSQVSGSNNRYFGIDGGDSETPGIGTYTFSINESSAYAGCNIECIQIAVGGVHNCEFAGDPGWNEFAANSTFEWQGVDNEVTFNMAATEGSGHYFNYSSITVYVQVPVSEEIHRLYNPNSGEHFYTADDGEAEWLVGLGWQDEGIGWIAPFGGDAPVYRLYNPNAEGGEHHFTMDIGEAEWLQSLGWEFEGVAWFSDEAEGMPIFRQYNPNEFSNNHNYTADEGEAEWLIGLGWEDEGIGWYGLAEAEEVVDGPVEVPVEMPIEASLEA